jgi:hypothetical protein
MIIEYFLYKFFRKTMKNVIDEMGDPLYADGTPVTADWATAGAPERPEERYEETLTMDGLIAYIKRLGQCLDKSLQPSQVEILEHRANALRSSKDFTVLYNVVQAGEMTNLEIRVLRPNKDTYELAIRGRGPAMKILAEELHAIESQPVT